MYIEFKKLHISNFMSFGEVELIFDNSGFIKVSGRNENGHDAAVSNGSGKSALWEAVVWAITGETIRGTKQSFYYRFKKDGEENSNVGIE